MINYSSQKLLIISSKERNNSPKGANYLSVHTTVPIWLPACKPKIPNLEQKTPTDDDENMLKTVMCSQSTGWINGQVSWHD
jgi:hypothetical protein